MRINLFDEATATDAQRAALATLRLRRPQPEVANVHRAILNAPTLVGPFIALADALRNETELDPGLRELAILATLKVLKSRYEFVRHWMLAQMAGVPQDKLLALSEGEGAAVFSDTERAVMRLARQVTTRAGADGETWRRAHEALGDRQIVELLMNIGLYNMTARLTEPIELEDEPSFVAPEGAAETFAK